MKSRDLIPVFFILVIILSRSGNPMAVAQTDHEQKTNLAEKLVQEGQELEQKGDTAQALNNLGVAHQNQGAYDEAIANFERALKIQEAQQRKNEVAQTLINLGNVYHRKAFYAQALHHYECARKLSEEIGDQSTMASAFNGLGSIYNEQRLDAKAIYNFEQALKIREALNEKGPMVSVLNNLGDLYRRLKAHAKARNYLERALKVGEEQGDRYGSAQALRNMGLVYSSQEDHDTAMKYYQRGLKISLAINAKSLAGYLYANLGDTYEALQQHAPAIVHLQQAVALGEELKEPRILWLSTRALGNLYERLGQLSLALHYIKRAATAVENVRARAFADEGKVGFSARQSRVYLDTIRVLYGLNSEDPKAGYGRQAFEYAERFKARALLDLLAESQAGVRQKIDPELRQRDHQMAARLSFLQKRFIELSNQSANEGIKKQLDVTQRELVSVSLEHDKLKNEIRRRSPAYAALIYPEPISVERTQKLLDEKTALLEYLLGYDCSYLFVVTHDQFHIYRMAEQEAIEQQVKPLIETIIPGPSLARNMAYLTTGHHVYRTLLGPAESLLQGKTSLIIIPDGRLAILPFAALLTSPAAADHPLFFQRLPYLVKNYELSFAPSASVLEWLKKNPLRVDATSKRLIVFADPVYESERNGTETAAIANRRGDIASDDPYAEALLGFYRAGMQLSRLPYTREESRQIAKLFGLNATQYLREEATEEKLKAEPLDQYQYVHIAAHGLVHPTRPEFSAIVLGHEGQEDGYLQLPEVYNLELQADLVTLSACESAIGQSIPGEGLIGLTRGFLYAGARSVVASLWKIADGRPTVNFMHAFYKNLGKQSKAQALRSAQLDFIKNERTSHPSNWSAFVLIGDR
ncbi:MAG: CHAT domain-containing protein [Acidobacteria bacterium]|nr:CHAT domain-containing protein [Acidobacteriota bacterium]MBI3655081.1 CHAT domain-containing protein [Acidobacteriota bacterium]